MSTFQSAFTQATTRYGRFSHAAHLHVAWTLLRDLSALDALAEFCAGLRALAARMGIPEKYHETLTVAWFFLVLERLDRGETWEAFEARNPELFMPGLIERHYARDVLDSPAARQGFLVPVP